jgi:hypothetical protein
MSQLNHWTCPKTRQVNGWPVGQDYRTKAKSHEFISSDIFLDAWNLVLSFLLCLWSVAAFCPGRLAKACIPAASRLRMPFSQILHSEIRKNQPSKGMTRK